MGAQVQMAAPAETTSLRLGSIRLLVPQENPTLFYETLVMNSYGAARLRPGDQVVDVGANVGDYSILAARRVGPTGRVIAIEPNPRWFPILLANIRENNLSNVTPLRVALADASGHRTFVGDRMSLINEESSVRDSYTATSITLDELTAAQGLSHIDVLKMDIEGAEGMVLRGQRTLDHTREVIMEIHGVRLFDELSTLFAAKGFKMRRFGARTMIFESARSILCHLPSYLISESRTNFYGTRRSLGALLLGHRIMVANPDQSELNVVHFSTDSADP